MEATSMQHGARIYLTAVLLLLAVSGDAVLADLRANNEFDRALQSCVTLHAIHRTEIIDDYTILFHMRNRTIYQNNLRRRCPNLKADNMFVYQTRMGRLCYFDSIVVAQGRHLFQGVSCPLGKFAPISEEAADEAKRVAAVFARR
jgi:hypothetical protein